MEKSIKSNEDDQLDVQVDSVALKRLIEEVRNDDVEVRHTYNRVYNRHNRS